MLKFKTIFKNHKIALIVDNVKTHPAKKFENTKLFKKAGINCSYEYMEWEEHGKLKSFDFIDKEGVSKGLFNACEELKLMPEYSHYHA